MKDFQFEHLATFAAVVEYGTFEAAARQLQVTASAVSQRIKAMEQAAGRVLLQRSVPVVATAAGEPVMRLARQVRQLQADTARELAGGGAAVTLPLAVNADSLATWFLPVLARLPRDAGASFELHREDEQHSADLLRAGRVMAAVTAAPAKIQGCTVEALGSLRYRAVASPEFLAQHQPRDAGTARLGWLGRAPVVDFDRKDELQSRFFRRLTGRVLEAPRHYVPASAEFAGAVRLGLGWALLPEQQCLADLEQGTLRELAPESPVDVPLFWQRWKIGSALLDGLTAVVRGTAAQALRPPAGNAGTAVQA
ncbi:LysR family transcriptional regulator ArgP [Arthrobacter sp. I2-34]|uniref:LysR family transcriptional regulator ArgP n=1 Tax=Arthrobacter hankyongi TaxID=2904801 RepID=A0ABS9L5M6_9MICC|nr:LysR family transcriptional regulator ArgP [Arthrobacter hankyongi]MCG2621883.1 LysR family transcriptional regulator ArgP [Arthrobacter hankyongi]